MKIIFLITGVVLLVLIGSTVLIGHSFFSADSPSLVDNYHEADVPAGEQTTQTIKLGPAQTSVVEVRTSAPAFQISLESPSGKALEIAPKVSVDAATGETIRTYQVPPQVESGAWRVVASNQNSAPSRVRISTPVANPPLEVMPITPPATPPSITLSLTVGQGGATGDDTIVNIEVEATVTAPSGDETVVILNSDPNNPDTYVGDYSGATDPGTYGVEYVINGTTEAGQQFTQTTTGEFTVGEGGSGTGSGSNNYSSSNTWQNTYDFDRGDALDLIEY